MSIHEEDARAFKAIDDAMKRLAIDDSVKRPPNQRGHKAKALKMKRRSITKAEHHLHVLVENSAPGRRIRRAAVVLASRRAAEASRKDREQPAKAAEVAPATP